MASTLLEIVPVDGADSDKISWNHPSMGLVHVTHKRLSGKIEHSVGLTGLDRVVSENIDHKWISINSSILMIYGFPLFIASDF